MRSLRFLVVIPVWLVLIAAQSPSPTPTPTPTPTPSPPPTPTPAVTPTPMGANIVLDSAAGGPSTSLTVNGSGFLAHESMTLYWDTPSHVAGSAVTDVGGNFTTSVRPFPGDSPGAHHLCVSVPPNPCATFTLQGAPTPTPPASPTPSPSPSPSATASPMSSPDASPARLAANPQSSGLDVIMKPPLVFLPIIGLLGILAALAYWLLMRGDRTPVIPTASVVHRSARPEIARPPAQPASPAPPTPPAPEMQPPPQGPETPEPPAY